MGMPEVDVDVDVRREACIQGQVVIMEIGEAWQWRWYQVIQGVFMESVICRVAPEIVDRMCCQEIVKAVCA